MEAAPVQVIKKARAYVYCGEWVADCPRNDGGGCSNVEFVMEPIMLRGPRVKQKTFFICSHCGWQADILWPREMEAIMRVLMQRPVPDNRNWYPQGHHVALRFRLPHGQSVKELMDENAAHDVPTGV